MAELSLMYAIVLFLYLYQLNVKMAVKIHHSSRISLHALHCACVNGVSSDGTLGTHLSAVNDGKNLFGSTLQK